MHAIRRWREAIRRRQDAGDRLADLYRQRDALAANAPPGSVSLGAPTSPAELDKQITDAQAELADADAALQTASPNYGQLVQQVVPAADVLAALAAGRGAGRDHAHAARRLEFPAARRRHRCRADERRDELRSLHW